jgi:hypothetical protein
MRAAGKIRPVSARHEARAGQERPSVNSQAVEPATPLAGVTRLNSITVQMSCPEYLRLRQHYDVALQRWAETELSSDRPEVIVASARLAEVIRQKALNERNAAIERMRLHEQNCPTCSSWRKPHIVN